MSVNARVVLLVEDDTSLYIPCRVGNSWGSHVYVHDGYMRTNKKIDSHITKIRRAFRRSVLKIFEVTGVDKCEGHTLGWIRQDSIHPHVEFETLGVFMCMYMMVTMCTNKKVNSYITKIWRAFRHSVPFWKIFWNRRRLVRESYSWLNTTRLYTSHVEFETLWVYKRT